MIRITISDLEIIKNGKINSVYNLLEMHIENLFTSKTGNVSARVTLAEGSKKAQLPYHSRQLEVKQNGGHWEKLATILDNLMKN